MCLAIYKPKGIEIKKKYLRNGFDNNEDGAGFAIARNGKVEIFKGFFTFGAFWKVYKEYANQTAIIHFRWATHGNRNEENCHPFSLNRDKFAIIHNGILNIDTSKNKEKSDTWHFAELVLSPLLRDNRPDAPHLKFLIESAIGSQNKIVVLKGDGSHVIYNEKAGQWHSGAWFSNDGFKREPYLPIWSAVDSYWTRLGGRHATHNYLSKLEAGTDGDNLSEREMFPDYDPERDVEYQQYLADEREAEEQEASLMLEAEMRADYAG